MAQINTTQNFDEIVQQVAKAIQALRFGSVEVTVHKVVSPKLKQERN